MRPAATLITFATGDIYRRYADAMFATAERYFFPGRSQFLCLETTPVWPLSIRDRHTHILAHRREIRGRFVFFTDADLLYEGPVDDEIVGDGVTAVLHPVQNSLPPEKMTYERNPDSAAYMAPEEGGRYYLGGIIGAPTPAFLDLSRQIDAMCRADGDYTPIWQDESYVNRLLADAPPALELDERYCAWWNHSVADARIRALNKTADEFRWRESLREEVAPTVDQQGTTVTV